MRKPVRCVLLGNLPHGQAELVDICPPFHILSAPFPLPSSDPFLLRSKKIDDMPLSHGACLSTG